MSATLTSNVQALQYKEEEESSSGTSGVSQNQNIHHLYGTGNTSYPSSSVCEISEEECYETFETRTYTPVISINEEYEGSLYSHSNAGGEDNSVYVAVGPGESSMEALKWTLNNLVTTPTITVYLVHVFPEIKLIPSPLGKLPKDQVSALQVESYMNRERDKRRELLQSYMNACQASKAKVDTILIESDFVAKAILDLVLILQITKLVIGTSKSKLRKLKSRRGNGTVDQILQNAPDICDVKVVCEGKEVLELMNESPSPMAYDTHDAKISKDEAQINNPFSCICFKHK